MNRTNAFIVPQKKDKILVWIGAEFVHYFLTHSLQKKLDAEYYAIIDITNKPKKFFEEQKFVDFKKVWFYHDEIRIKDHEQVDLDYLKKFEEMYDINLWKLAINERIFYRFYNFYKFTGEEILKIEEKSAKFFEKILRDIEPNFFLTKVPSFHHLELLKEMCKRSNCKTLMLSPPKMGYRVLLSEDATVFDYTKNLDDVKGSGRNFDEMREYLDSHSGYLQLKNYYEKSSKKNLNSELSVLFDYLFSSNHNIHTNYNYFGRTKKKVLKNILDSKIKKNSRERFMNKKLLKQIDLKKPFIYFAMSTDLERYLLIDSPFYTNQIEVIRHVAKSIPINYLLYIKENPSNVTRDWRSVEEYNDLLKIPNVRLLHPTFSNKELLSNCSLVVSIAGSSGLEAAFFEKPSIVFGNVLYSILPSVHKVNNLEDLPKMIRKSVNEKVNQVDLDKFLTVLDKNTFDFDMTEFTGNIAEKFYFNETTVDVDIKNDDVDKFLNENQDVLEIICDEHIKKILQHKEILK